MLHNLRRRAEEEKGFTLIELLVVILIIGILAAIAIPSFINQRSKASDASAKELARTMETAAETYATDHSGLYWDGANLMTATDLATIEPSIQIGAGNNNAYAVAGTGVSGIPATHDGYTVTATSPNGNTYSITRASNGALSRSCTVPAGANRGGCAAGNTW